MASKPLVIEARVATELLKSDVQKGAELLGNVGDAAAAVADKLEQSLGKAGAKFGPWAGAAQDAISKVRNSSSEMAKEIERLAGRIANSNGDTGVAAAQEAVQAQRAKLAAILEVEAAARRMIGTDRELTAAEQQYFEALQSSKNAAGARLTQLAAEAGALERLQIELQATGAARRDQAAAGGNGGSGTAGAVAMAAAADRLRARIDPMFTAQKQFDDELTQAETLLASGAIRQNEYASAVALATSKLQAYQAALFDTNKAQSSGRPSGAPAGPPVPVGPSAAEMAALAASADRVRSALDPMYAAQKRFDDELTQAERLLAAGIITEREYQGAVTVATQALRAHSNALHGIQDPANQVVNAHRGMSVSSMMLMHSVRSGADSFAAGLPPMMIFSEQISRLAEAAAYAAQETGATTGVMATFGRVMSGVSGIAIVAAISLLGTLISHMDLFKDKVGDAVKKLQEQAESTETAATAQKIFDATLDGSIATQRKMNDELEKELQTRQQLVNLKAAQARQGAVEAKSNFEQAQKELTAARAALASEKSAPAPAPGTGGMGFNPAAAATANRSSAAQARYDKAYDAYQDAEKTARLAQIPVLDLHAKALADPKEAARQSIEEQRATNRSQRGLNVISPDEYTQREADLDKQEAALSKTGKKGPSADTLAKRAEAARVKLIGQDEAYTDQERAARHKLLDATAKTAASEDARDAILREDIEAEAAATKKKIADQLAAKKITPDQATHLVGLAEQTRVQKLDNVDLQRRSQDVKDASAGDVATLDRQIAMKQIEDDMATTAKKRRDIGLQILDLQEQRERALAQAVLANPLSTTADKDAADARIQAVDDQHSSKVAKIEDSTASPMEAYGKQLSKSTGDINTSLQTIEVSGLQNLSDSFASVVTQSQSADKAITSMVTSTLSQLAKLAAQKLILSVIGLKSGGTVSSVGGRASGGLLGFANGGLPGFAGGTRGANGMISGPGSGTSDSILALVNGKKPIMVSNDEGIVNAQAVRNYWPAIDAMNKGTYPRFATGGLLGPRIPSITGMGARAGSVVQHFTIDAKGAILANDLMSGMQQVSSQQASAALASAPALTQQQMARKSNNRIPT